MFDKSAQHGPKDLQGVRMNKKSPCGCMLIDLEFDETICEIQNGRQVAKKSKCMPKYLFLL
jgi:hypothetical protein